MNTFSQVIDKEKTRCVLDCSWQIKLRKLYKSSVRIINTSMILVHVHAQHIYPHNNFMNITEKVCIGIA